MTSKKSRNKLRFCIMQLIIKKIYVLILQDVFLYPYSVIMYVFFIGYVWICVRTSDFIFIQIYLYILKFKSKFERVGYRSGYISKCDQILNFARPISEIRRHTRPHLVHINFQSLGLYSQT